jgi:hypothetical protein
VYAPGQAEAAGLRITPLRGAPTLLPSASRPLLRRPGSGASAGRGGYQHGNRTLKLYHTSQAPDLAAGMYQGRDLGRDVAFPSLSRRLARVKCTESGSTRPVVRSSLTTASCPFSAADDSGVYPLWCKPLDLESGSTLFVANSSLTTASCPPSAANDSGVRSPPLESGSTRFVASSSLTTASCPLLCCIR